MGGNHKNYVIGASDSSRLIPELLPPAYRNHNTDEPDFLNTSLGGSLAIILALAAFSRDPNKMSIVDTIEDHFRPLGSMGWKLHHTPEDSSASKSIVLKHVDISI